MTLDCQRSRARRLATSCAWCSPGIFWNAAAGIAAGVLLSLVVDQVASRWVTESARDPLILAGVISLLVAVAVVACLAPARRAAAIDPMHALRMDWVRAETVD